jgi:hypothetical protein
MLAHRHHAYPCSRSNLTPRGDGRTCFTVTTRFTMSREQKTEGRRQTRRSAACTSITTRGSRRQKTGSRDFLPSDRCPLPSEPTHACVVGLGRFERPTSRLSGVRSDQLSYRPRSRRQRAAGSRRRRLLPSESCLLIRKGCVDGDPGRLLGRCHASCPMPQRLRLLTSDLCPLTSDLRKEVIQPQVPLRLPCYDFTPVADLTVDGCPPCGLAHRLRVKPTPMV